LGVRRQNCWRKRTIDLGPHKIRVHAVCPGPILTDRSSHRMEILGTTAEEFDARDWSKTFVGRAGQARDVAAAVLLLASDKAGYITGSRLMVDGGYSVQ
jgi:meso-butanediol dehydrogenase / (S,S)-butanediol dehydrogenase / diacetyl reductase